MFQRRGEQPLNTENRQYPPVLFSFMVPLSTAELTIKTIESIRKPMKIGIAIWSITYGKGGSERACCALANWLATKGHDVVIFYNDPDGCFPSAPAYPLKETIALHNLRLIDHKDSRERARAMLIRENLDTLIIFATGSTLLWFPPLLYNTGIPALYTERSAPSRIRHLLWNPAEHTACTAAMDHIVLLMHSFQALYPDFLQPRISVIPNAVTPPKLSACAAGTPEQEKTLLVVGRCQEDPKQLSLLLRAFAGLAKVFPDWRLKHCGDGPDRAQYIALAHSLGIAERVTFAGVLEDIAPEYAAAHLFCLPSRFEGCSNALLEALASGLPAVGFADAPGVNELIVHGTNGLLAPEMTAESLAQTLLVLMAKPQLRGKMGEKAQQASLAFTPDIIFAKWENLIQTVAQCKGATRLMGTIPTTPEATAQAMLNTILVRSEIFSPFTE